MAISARAGVYGAANVKNARRGYLNSLPDAAPVSTTFGRVVIRTDGYPKNEQPIAGAQVEISGTTRDTHIPERRTSKAVTGSRICIRRHIPCRSFRRISHAAVSWQ